METIIKNIAINNSKIDVSGFRSKYRKKMLSPTFLLLITDSIAIILSYFVHYFIRFHSNLISTNYHFEPLVILLSSLFLLIYWFVLFFFSGMYKKWYERSPFEEIFNIIRIIFIGCSLIVIFVYFDGGADAPNYAFISYFLLISSFVIISRVYSRILQKNLKIKGILSTPIIIIGTQEEAYNLVNDIKKSPAWGYKVIGTILLMSEQKNNPFNINELKILGLVDDCEAVLDKFKPEEILIAVNSSNHSVLSNIVATAAGKNIRVKIQPDLYDIFTGQNRASHIYGIPLIEITPELLKPWQEVIKRAFDIVFSLLVLILGLPFWIIIAIIVRLESPGAIFYKQERVGKREKVFKMYKFRSMISGADKKRSWTEVNDSRVTKFGKILRKTHLDEIPQFYNTLIGDMSIVGPRPEQPKFVSQFSMEIPYYLRRLSVRPGITGWWQVKYQPHVLDKNEIENRLKDDFYYIENMSIKLDLEIVVRTVWCVIKGHGQT